MLTQQAVWGKRLILRNPFNPIRLLIASHARYCVRCIRTYVVTKPQRDELKADFVVSSRDVEQQIAQQVGSPPASAAPSHGPATLVPNKSACMLNVSQCSLKSTLVSQTCTISTRFFKMNAPFQTQTTYLTVGADGGGGFHADERGSFQGRRRRSASKQDHQRRGNWQGSSMHT